MLTLLLDTAYLGLNIGIANDDVLIDKVEILAKQKQSEITLPMLKELFDKHNLDPLDITEICITEGPGSFTGLRIAMTIAKVIATLTSSKLYTVNTLLTYVHPTIDKGWAIMDARSQRAYVALIEKGEFSIVPQVKKLEDIDTQQDFVFGDGQLLSKESQDFSLIDNMLAYKNKWKLIEDVDSLVPLYLKENQDYGNQ